MTLLTKASSKIPCITFLVYCPDECFQWWYWLLTPTCCSCVDMKGVSRTGRRCPALSRAAGGSAAAAPARAEVARPGPALTSWGASQVHGASRVSAQRSLLQEEHSQCLGGGFVVMELWAGGDFLEYHCWVLVNALYEENYFIVCDSCRICWRYTHMSLIAYYLRNVAQI